MLVQWHGSGAGQWLTSRLHKSFPSVGNGPLERPDAWRWRESQRALLAGSLQAPTTEVLALSRSALVARNCHRSGNAVVKFRARSCKTLVDTSCPFFAWAGRPQGADLA